MFSVYEVRERLGRLNFKQLWAEAPHTTACARNTNLLDEKACDTYYGRVRDATECGNVSDIDFLNINARDVTVSLRERFAHWLQRYRLPAFFAGIIETLRAELNYDDICPF